MILLTILDGWGVAPAGPGNAIANACTPNFDWLLKNYPHTLLEASGEWVGLPAGQMGNSEVGHLNIGAGRIVYQELTRINKAIVDGSFFENEVLKKAMQHSIREGSALHLIGLVSDGGVHSDLTHLFALLEMAKKEGLSEVYIHCILDGRDTPPDNARTYINKLEDKIKELKLGKIATVSGRYYAMDRDKRWDRTEKAYRAFVLGEGEKATSAIEAIEKSYEKGIFDEFVVPTVIIDENGKTIGQIKDGDAIIFFNFRADRMRQIVRAFIEDNSSFFSAKLFSPAVYIVTFTSYDQSFNLPVAFAPQILKDILGEVISKNGLKQLRIAETEKYAHVTFFFNGGEETPFAGEDRILIPSPKVATYDLKPEMSAFEVTDAVLAQIRENKYDFIVLNYANPDMVGHTGNLKAAIQAVEAVDQCLGRLIEAAAQQKGTLLVTADHGNAEVMMEEDLSPHTAHTSNPVPFILMNEGLKDASLHKGILSDIAPTILGLMNLPQPMAMTGKNLVNEKTLIKTKEETK